MNIRSETSLDDIIMRVNSAMPPLNHYLLKEFPRQQIARTTDYMSTVFAEAAKLFNGAMVFVDSAVLSPEARIAFEIKHNKGVPIARSEFELVAFNFTYRGIPYTTHLYMPYLFQDMIVIQDKKYAIQRGITERVFSRTPGGVTVRVIRAPLQFIRADTYRLVSAVSGDYSNEFIYATNLYLDQRQRSRKGVVPTILLYLLCKFGFTSTMSQFGLGATDLSFTKEIGEDTEEFDYYVAKKPTRHPDLYLRVRRTVLADPLGRKIVANLLYTLTGYSMQTIQGMTDPQGDIFRIMLGRILRPNEPELAALGHVNTHMFSVDIFIDQLSRDRINEFGVAINDIYDLLKYVLIEMDRLMVSSTSNSLYDTRIDHIDGLLAQTMVRRIYLRFYNIAKRIGKLKEQDIGTLFRMPPMMISGIYQSDNVITPTFYGNGWLNVGCLKLRQTGQYGRVANPQAPESRFDASFPVVESIGVFSGKNPGVTGLINPHLPITKGGAVIRPDYAKELDELQDVLPH